MTGSLRFGSLGFFILATPLGPSASSQIHPSFHSLRHCALHWKASKCTCGGIFVLPLVAEQRLIEHCMDSCLVPDNVLYSFRRCALDWNASKCTCDGRRNGADGTLLGMHDVSRYG